MYPVVPSEWLTGFHQHGKEQRSFVYIIAPRLYRYYVYVRVEDKVPSSTPLHGIPAGIVDSSCNIRRVQLVRFGLDATLRRGKSVSPLGPD